MILNLHSPGPKPFKIPTANSHWKRNTLLTSDRRRNPPDQLGQSTSVENLQNSLNSLPSHQNYFFLSFSLFFFVLGVLCIVFLCSHNLAIPASLPGLRSHQLHYLHTFGTGSICEWSLGERTTYFDLTTPCAEPCCTVTPLRQDHGTASEQTQPPTPKRQTHPETDRNCENVCIRDKAERF